MTILGILWFFLVFLLIAGYFVLDGFDLGAGILYPFIAKDEAEQAVIRRALGPVWDGNEVWLLTAGGALFAAFPDAYATTFSGFYLAIMLVLFGLIVRAVSFEFWSADTKWRPVWNFCFFMGSFLPALLFGVAIGNILAGIPMDVDGNYIGVPLLGLITPFTLLCGVFGLVMFIAAGACWIALKAPLDSDLQIRAAGVRAPMQIIAIILFVALTVYLFVGMGGDARMNTSLMTVRYLLAVLFVVVMIVALSLSNSRSVNSYLSAFICQSLGAVSAVFLLACSMFPVLVFASQESVGPAITIMNSGASELSLFCMTVILCIGLPLVLIYHIVIYRTFRGRISEQDLVH